MLTELKSHSHYSVLRVHDLITVDVDLVHLAEAGFFKFFHCEVTFIPLFMLHSLEGSHWAQPALN